MRILLMADYKGGYEITKYLRERNEDIVGLVVRPPCMESYLSKGYTQKIIETLNLPEDRVFFWADIDSGKRLTEIKALKPNKILTMFCCGILKPELVRIPTDGCINIHTAYLPYNRGRNPNVWAIIDGTPGGVTIHYIDEYIDTGDIIAQTMIPVESTDTAETLYNKIDNESVELFKRTWPKIKDGTADRIKQDDSKKTLHYGKDFQKLDIIHLEKEYTARALIDLLRARTFPPHPSAYFVDENGRKVYVRVQLEYAEDGKA